MPLICIYINVLLFYSVEILYNELLGFKGAQNNENTYVAIANEIVNCSFIQASLKVCFTNYNFEILNISSFVVCLCAISIKNIFF